MKLDQYCSVPQQTGLEGTDAGEPPVPDPPHDQLGRQMLRPLAKFDALAAIVPFLSGAARRCAIRSDGSRLIVDLLPPGDSFGLAFGDRSDATIEATEEGTVVASYPRPRIEVLADSDPKIGRTPGDRILALSRMQTQLLILSRITAPEKVGSFILEMTACLSN